MRKRIEFKSEGQEIVGTIIRSEELRGNNPAVLFIHGLTGHKESSYQYADSLAKLGHISFLFDMRGHGETGGDVAKLTLVDFLKDCINAYDHLLEIDGVDKDNISVVGSSMGAYLAALLTSERKFKRLAMRAPADYPDEVFNKPTVDYGGENPDTMKWRKQQKDHHGSAALKAVHAFHGPVLVIESENDDMVPHMTVQNYIEAVNDKSKVDHVVLKGAPHSIKEGKFRDQVEKILIDGLVNKKL